MTATVDPRRLELASAWLDREPAARWRSAAVLGPGTGARACGASVLEIPRGCRLPRHTDSAEEVIVVTGGSAEIQIADEVVHARDGVVALVPADTPHEVRNVGEGTLCFVAVYASTDVVTSYEAPVRPGGSRTRRPVA